MTATPPFDIDQTLPADDDVVSQHPGYARTFRDVVEQWLLTEHDTYGHHSIPNGDDSARDAQDNIAEGNLWFNTEDSSDKHLQYYDGSAWQRIMPIYAEPAGTLKPFAGRAVDIPSYYLPCLGETLGDASSGADYASDSYETLFNLLKHGWGNTGSETFSSHDTVLLPDLGGRTIAGLETSASRMTSTYGPDGATLGAYGGSQSHALTSAENGPHTHNFNGAGSWGDDSGSNNQSIGGTNIRQTLQSGTASSGSGTPHTSVQPTAMAPWIISTGGV